MQWIAVSSPEELGLVALGIVKAAVTRPHPVLALPTGNTPLPLYHHLVDAFRWREISLRHVITFNLDEYVGLSPDDPASYHAFMEQHLFSHVDIPAPNIHIPDGTATDLDAECRRYDALIKHFGPWTLAIVGVGQNGHIGFNEPGDDWNQTTHVVTLAESTRRANAVAFAGRSVPRQAITVGIRQILAAEHVLLLIAGDKRQALHALRRGEVTPQWPVTSLLRHPRVTVIADRTLLDAVG